MCVWGGGKLLTLVVHRRLLVLDLVCCVMHQDDGTQLAGKGLRCGEALAFCTTEVTNDGCSQLGDCNLYFAVMIRPYIDSRRLCRDQAEFPAHVAATKAREHATPNHRTFSSSCSVYIVIRMHATIF